MKIGEFAKLCGTRISVLRHYDKEGLLIPEFVDNFTGYRYYVEGQLAVFMRISALKKAGFSLKEIRDLLSRELDNTEILVLIEEKRTYFTSILSNLNEAKRILTKGESSMKQSDYKIITIPLNEEERLYELKTEPVDPAELQDAYSYLLKSAEQQNYQRISSFKTYGLPDSGEISAAIEVIRLHKERSPLWENTDIPFENDPSVVGKWEIIGEYAVKEEFYADQFQNEPSLGSKNRTIYFLPGGEKYWCYGWSKGYLITESGDGAALNRYTLESWQRERYMFVEYKSYHYRKGGRPTVLVMRQLDNKGYTKEEIARRDNIEFPFITDLPVIGIWNTVAKCRSTEDFDDTKIDSGCIFFYRSVEFQADGVCKIHYRDGKTTVHSWTKGVVLRTNDKLACAYKIQKINGTEYLFLEFKNGDYVWSGFDPTYFVFIRNS